MEAKTPEQADALANFAYWHVRSGDIDPVYPVLRILHDLLCDDEEEALRLTFLYVAYYNLPSAVAAWNRGVFTKPGRLPDLTIAKFPTGTERRAHRMPHKLVEHLAYLDGIASNYGSLSAWLETAVQLDPANNWQNIQHTLRNVRHNGRWAAYKTGEILATVHRYDLEPTDAGHDFSSGPRAGLADCYPETANMVGYKPNTVRVLDNYTWSLKLWLEEETKGVYPIEQVETVLCDWHSVQKGHYYVGHDIDLLLEQTYRAAADGRFNSTDLGQMLDARGEAFESRWLGEANDWDGVRKPLKRAYIDDGIIEWWA